LIEAGYPMFMVEVRPANAERLVSRRGELQSQSFLNGVHVRDESLIDRLQASRRPRAELEHRRRQVGAEADLLRPGGIGGICDAPQCLVHLRVRPAAGKACHPSIGVLLTRCSTLPSVQRCAFFTRGLARCAAGELNAGKQARDRGISAVMPPSKARKLRLGYVPPSEGHRAC